MIIIIITFNLSKEGGWMDIIRPFEFTTLCSVETNVTDQNEIWD